MEGPIKLKPREAYLKEGIKPIIVWVGVEEDFKKELESTPKFGLNNLYNVDWESGLFYSEKGINSHVDTFGEKTFVISNIDSNNKFSEGLIACVSLVVVGRKKNSIDNISFMTHQNPALILEEHSLIHLLKDVLKQFRLESESSTIDAVLVGGISFPKHTRAVGYIAQAVKDTLGIDLLIVNGPKIIKIREEKYGETPPVITDSIYFDNENRRLYLVRPQVNQVLDKVYPDIDITTYEKNKKEN